jgi:hypothetical protein
MAITYTSTVYACAVQGIWVTVLLRCWVFMSALNGQWTNIMKFEDTVLLLCFLSKNNDYALPNKWIKIQVRSTWVSRGDDYRNNCSCKLTTMSRFVAIQSFSSVCIFYSHSVLCCVYIVCCQILLEVLRTLDSQNLSHASTNISCHQQDMKDPERENRVKWKSKLVQE